MTPHANVSSQQAVDQINTITAIAACQRRVRKGSEYNQQINASARSPDQPNILAVRVALRIRRPPNVAGHKFLFVTRSVRMPVPDKIAE